MLITLTVIAFLLAMSAFFSGSETALTAASRPLMHQLEQNGDPRAARVNRLYERKDRLIGTILLGNNLVNILASALATSVLISLFGEAGVAYATLGMTVLVLIFAEILPKTYAIHNSNKAALHISPVINAFVIVLTPLTATMEMIVSGLLHIFGARKGGELLSSDEELRGAIDLHNGDDEAVRHERAMLRSVLDLDEVQVVEIMTHRMNVIAVDADQSVDLSIEQILASPFTRIPLWRGSPDNIVGVLHAKALLQEIRSRGSNTGGLDLTALATEPWFIPEQTLLLDQLEGFRKRREHFALVVDEYGSLMGIVTLEDILEEIVGDIDDEHDVAFDGVQIEAEGGFVVDGTVTIRELNREYEWGLPDEEAATVAGLILHEARRIPNVGQRFKFFGFQFEILERQHHQITSVRITPPEAEDDWTIT